jgi:hypothetical protein
VRDRKLAVRFEGTMADLPVQVKESFLGTTTTCSVDIRGAEVGLPFSFEWAIPLETAEVAPAVEEITGVGEPAIENVDVELAVEGNLVCLLFQAAQGAFVTLLVESLTAATSSVAENLGSQLVGLRLCGTQ